MISFGLTEEQEMIRDTVREFAAGELAARARECDEASTVPEELLEKSWELGLANGAIPETYGGGGLPREWSRCTPWRVRGERLAEERL